MARLRNSFFWSSFIVANWRKVIKKRSRGFKGQWFVAKLALLTVSTLALDGIEVLFFLLTDSLTKWRWNCVLFDLGVNIQWTRLNRFWNVDVFDVSKCLAENCLNSWFSFKGKTFSEFYCCGLYTKMDFNLKSVKI